VPPGQGMKFIWHLDANGQLCSGEPASTTGRASSQAAVSTSAASPRTASSAAFGKEQVNLPPATAIWGFRLQTTAFADKLVKGIVSQDQGTPNPFLECLARIIRGALMDKDVYRTAASSASLTAEAVWVAVALVVISTLGLSGGNLFGYASSFLLKAMIIRAIGWLGAVFAVHYVARAWQKVAMPPVAWFRAMVYAQSALLLSIVPIFGILVTIWVAVCTVGALQDVSGKDTKVGITLLVVAGMASAAIASVIGSVQL
jgi:hypothetical protein